MQIAELLSLLLIASIVGVATKYIKLPYTIALVLVGLLVGTLKIFPEIQLTEEIIFFIILPPLLFEGALSMDISQLRQNFKPVLLLSTVGVLISVVIIGFSLHYFLGISLPIALLFGAMVTPTDPVSVLATFKALGVPKRLSTIVEGESIFNDGTGIVLFALLLEMVKQGSFDLLSGIIKFFFVVLGGQLLVSALAILPTKFTGILMIISLR